MGRVMCVHGKCDQCPAITVHVTQNLQNKKVTLSLWTYHLSAEKSKNIFGLSQPDFSVHQTVSAFFDVLPKLRQHIYTAHHQWQAHNQAPNNLDVSSVITIKDYQQNLEVVYAEQPTSMAYSSNKLTAAVYPTCVGFLAEINGQE